MADQRYIFVYGAGYKYCSSETENLSHYAFDEGRKVFPLHFCFGLL